MFSPPEFFAQLRAVLWAGPGAILIYWGLTLYGFGLRGRTLGLVLAVLVLLLLPGLVSNVWLSCFGWRHTLTAGTAITALLLLPMVFMGIAAVGINLQSLAVSTAVLITGGHIALLAGAAAWHHSRCRVDWATLSTKGRNLQWPGTVIKLRSCQIQRDPGNVHGTPISAGMLGGLSVSAYGLLKGMLGLELHRIVVAAAVETMVLWFLIMVVGRGIGQALQLRAIEQRLGCRFVSDRYAQIEAQRQRTVVGRLLRRRFKPA